MAIKNIFEYMNKVLEAYVFFSKAAAAKKTIREMRTKMLEDGMISEEEDMELKLLAGEMAIGLIDEASEIHERWKKR